MSGAPNASPNEKNHGMPPRHFAYAQHQPMPPRPGSMQPHHQQHPPPGVGGGGPPPGVVGGGMAMPGSASNHASPPQSPKHPVGANTNHIPTGLSPPSSFNSPAIPPQHVTQQYGAPQHVHNAYHMTPQSSSHPSRSETPVDGIHHRPAPPPGSMPLMGQRTRCAMLSTDFGGAAPRRSSTPRQGPGSRVSAQQPAPPPITSCALRMRCLVLTRVLLLPGQQALLSSTRSRLPTCNRRRSTLRW